jgi:hypothetical protein
MVLASDGKTTFGGAVVGTGIDLITPSGITYSGGSASISGGSVSFSGVTSIIVNGVFTSAYDNYFVTFGGTIASGQVDLIARLASAGTAVTSANYWYVTPQWHQTLSSNDTVSRGTSATSWPLRRLGTTYSAGTLRMMSPALTAAKSFFAECIDANSYLSIVGGSLTDTTSRDGLSLSVASSSMTGTVRVYGYKNS